MTAFGWDSEGPDFYFWVRPDLIDLEQATAAEVIVRVGAQSVTVPLNIVLYRGKPRLFVNPPVTAWPNGIEVQIALSATMADGSTVRYPARTGYVSALVDR